MATCLCVPGLLAPSLSLPLHLCLYTHWPGAGRCVKCSTPFEYWDSPKFRPNKGIFLWEPTSDSCADEEEQEEQEGEQEEREGEQEEREGEQEGREGGTEAEGEDEDVTMGEGPGGGEDQGQGGGGSTEGTGEQGATSRELRLARASKGGKRHANDASGKLQPLANFQAVVAFTTSGDYPPHRFLRGMWLYLWVTCPPLAGAAAAGETASWCC